MKIKREVTLKDRLSLLVVVGLSSLLVVGCAGKADICASAVEHLENCTGLDLQVPDACDPVEANRILNTDCAVLAAGETRTTSGFWDWLTGKPSGDGSAECYCDDVCKSKGDCCPGCPNSGSAPGGAGPSGQLQSGRGSCKGRCSNSPSGGPWPGKFPTCYCDNVCKSKGDCCPDYDAVCASTNSPGGSGTRWDHTIPDGW